MILKHIPRSWKAAGLLILLVISFTVALAGLTAVVLGTDKPVDWVRCISGLLVGTVSAILFYTEQQNTSAVKSQADVETEILNTAGKSLAEKQPAAEVKPWTMDDDK